MSRTTPTPTTAAVAEVRRGVPVRHERLVGLYVSVGAVAFNTLASQLHRAAGYSDAGGYRELPTYAGYALFGYLTAYALGMVAPHRLGGVARSARATAVVLALLGIVFSVFYFSSLPMQYGAAVLLLVSRARRHAPPTRLDDVLRLVAWLVAVGPYVVEVARIVDSALH
jgi:hypothetical protein